MIPLNDCVGESPFPHRGRRLLELIQKASPSVEYEAEYHQRVGGARKIIYFPFPQVRGGISRCAGSGESI